MVSPTDFAKMVPGFDFLQGLLKGGSGGMPGMVPGMGQWVAPTLDPAEIEKRIEELKTVQFWLEQNARLIGTTIQALEVQRMTLSTLKTMNLPLADVAQALTAAVPVAAPLATAATQVANTAMGTAAMAATAAAAPAARAVKKVAKKAAGSAAKKAAGAAGSALGAAMGAAARPAIDPMAWWGALTQQFGELAAKAVKDTAKESPKEGAAAVASSASKRTAAASRRPAAASARR
jgi:hypothetical protein